jgi:hypothetical protein
VTRASPPVAGDDGVGRGWLVAGALADAALGWETAGAGALIASG